MKLKEQNIPMEVYHNYAQVGYYLIKWCKENNIDMERIYEVIK